MTEKCPKLPEISPERVTNVCSDQMHAITNKEIKLATSKLKNGRTLAEDGIANEIIKLGRTATLDIWNNVNVISLYKKGY